MAEKQNNEWDERELGALWKKQSANGRKYLSGKLKVEGKDMNVVVGLSKTAAKDIPSTRKFVKDNFYNDMKCIITQTLPSGKRIRARKRIKDYDGSSRVLTFEEEITEFMTFSSKIGPLTVSIADGFFLKYSIICFS